jgi:hypothetical protein
MFPSSFYIKPKNPYTPKLAQSMDFITELNNNEFKPIKHSNAIIHGSTFSIAQFAISSAPISPTEKACQL